LARGAKARCVTCLNPPSNIENRHKEACLNLSAKLAESLGISIAELMAGV
jgi:hypothetical protein